MGTCPETKYITKTKIIRTSPETKYIEKTKNTLGQVRKVNTF